jgi:hypothetical protein
VDVHVPGGQQALFAMASGVPLKALPAGAWLHRAQPKAEEGERQRRACPGPMHRLLAVDAPRPSLPLPCRSFFLSSGDSPPWKALAGRTAAVQEHSMGRTRLHPLYPQLPPTAIRLPVQPRRGSPAPRCWR